MRMNSIVFVVAFLLSLLSVVVFISAQSTPEIYGNTFTFANDTETRVTTVQVSASGDFTYLFDDIIYLGDSESYDGISALDQQNKVFYFATNYLGAFIYVADIANKKVLPSLVTGLSFVNNINWDGVRNAIFVDGLADGEDGEKYYTIFEYSIVDGSILSLATFYNISIYYSAVDWKNGLYYFIDDQNLYTLKIDNPTYPSSSPVNCTDVNGTYFISYVYYDNIHQQLVGLGERLEENSIIFSFVTIIPINGSCNAVPIDLPEAVDTSYAYDPVNQNLYIAVVPESIYTYNVKSGSITQTPIDFVLLDLAVTYKF